MANKWLALNINGELTWCTCPPEKRGMGRCNHVQHQRDGETVDQFVERISELESDLKSYDDAAQDVLGLNALANSQEVSQQEIDDMAAEIDRIAGCHVTSENLKSVLSQLSADQVAQIACIGFNAAPVFSLPIRDEEYEDQNVKNKLYFTNLHRYGVGGSESAMQQMFEKVGPTPVHRGEMVDIESSYEKGLTPSEYFNKQFYARTAMITKGVGTAKPGYCIHHDSVVSIFDQDMQDFTDVRWCDVQVGDLLGDGSGGMSTVLEIRDWTQKPCYEMKARGHFKEIVVSEDHLMMADIILGGKIINSNLEHSKRCREAIGEMGDSWVSAQDVFNFHRCNAEIRFLGDKCSTLEYIKEYRGMKPQQVRCISTDVGYYETNGFVHHNTARKLFYSFSDTQVMHDCGGPYIDAMHCKLPNGHVCMHCAHATQGGETVHEGQLIGGVISTRLSEGLTQASMELKHPVHQNQPVHVLDENGALVERLWKEIQVGDRFPNGAKVLEVTPWQLQPCYRITSSLGDSLVCSENHLVKCEVLLEGDSAPANGIFRLTKRILAEMGLDESLALDELWVTTYDLYRTLKMNPGQGVKMHLLNQSGECIADVVDVERYALEPQLVSCIATDVGVYSIGSFVNHNTGTMASLDKANSSENIMAALNGWSSSKIVQRMMLGRTTQERRQILYECLREEYKNANLRMDDFNLQMVAKKLTSYKRDRSGVRPVEDGELCDVVSMAAIGNYNNIFKKLELKTGYREVTKPLKQRIGVDAVNQIIG